MELKNKLMGMKPMMMRKRAKVGKVMGEFKRGTLNIGKSPKKVKSRAQALAIALNESGMSK